MRSCTRNADGLSAWLEWLGKHKQDVVAVKDLATALALLIGGVWAFQKLAVKREFAPQIEFTVDVDFVGVQGESWIANLIASLNNKGGSRLRASAFDFSLRSVESGDELTVGKESYNCQTCFPRKLKGGSWLPGQWGSTYIEPNTCTRYSHVTHISRETNFVLLHGRIRYWNRVMLVFKFPFHHTSDCVRAVPVAASVVEQKVEEATERQRSAL